MKNEKWEMRDYHVLTLFSDFSLGAWFASNMAITN
jgi:hypothetical protein